ncbi:MAG TPA: hypothetical protein VGQ62_19020 [Chloroflexota bacterium]|nr:hypothetical protein [Chloroflexota bacterium]
MEFELRHLDSGKLIYRYTSEGAALAFVRDVVRVGGRDQAAKFSLDRRDDAGQALTVAMGADLVKRAIEDRSE